MVHEHCKGLAADASRHILSGDVSPLEVSYGAAWVQRWAQTGNFARWAARNKLGAAARLWRARLEASAAASSDAGGPRKELPPTVAAGVSQVKAATGRAAQWLRQRMGGQESAAEDADGRPASPATLHVNEAARPGDSAASAPAPDDGAYFGARQGGLAHGRGALFRGDGAGDAFEGTILLGDFYHGMPNGHGVE
eukprot:3102126-Prymnesium_polylepis.1